MKQPTITPAKLLLLSLLAGLAGWSWWLNLDTDEIMKEPTTTDTDLTLDYYVRGFETFIMDSTGQRIRSLQSDTLNHFLADGVTELDNPILQIYEQSSTPAWQVTAEHGRISEDGSELLLSGKVEIDQQQGINGIPMHIVTSDLMVQPKQNYAETGAPVTITSGTNWMKSTGMQAWLQEPAHIKFSSKTRGYYVIQQN